MPNSSQPQLFYESINDALREVVQGLGGFKKVGAFMRPELPIDQAGRWVSDCLNPDRRELFNPDHMLMLLREGRRIGCHAAMNFLCGDAGYAPAEPIEPEDELAALQRTFIESVQVQGRIADRIEQLMSAKPHLKSAA